MKHVKPKMAHNDRFFFSPLRVGSSQEVALLRRDMKERFHSFQVASEKFSFMCIPISYPWREAFFFFSGGGGGGGGWGGGGEFYALPLYFLRLYNY